MPKFGNLISLSTATKTVAGMAAGVGATMGVQHYMGSSEFSKDPQIMERREDQQKKMSFEVQQLSKELEERKRNIEMQEQSVAKKLQEVSEKEAALQRMQQAMTEQGVQAGVVAVETVQQVAQAKEPADVQPEEPKADVVPANNAPRRPAVFDGGGNKEKTNDKQNDDSKRPVVFGSSGDVVTIEKGGAVSDAETERLRKEVENLRRRLAYDASEKKRLRGWEDRLRERERALSEKLWKRNMQSKTDDPLLEAAFGGSSDPFDKKPDSKKVSINDASGSNREEDPKGEKEVSPSVHIPKKPWGGSVSELGKFQKFIGSVESNEKASPKEVKKKEIMQHVINDLNSKKTDLKENTIIRDLEVDIENIADEKGAISNFLKEFPEYNDIHSYGLLTAIAGKLEVDSSIQRKTLTVEDVLQALRNSVSRSAPRILDEIKNAPQVTEDDSLSASRKQQRSTNAKAARPIVNKNKGATVVDPDALVKKLKEGAEKNFKDIFDKDGFIGKKGRTNILSLEDIMKEIKNFNFKPVQPKPLDPPPQVVADPLAPPIPAGLEPPAMMGGGFMPPPPPPPPVPAFVCERKKPSEKKTADEKMPDFSCDVDPYNSDTIAAFLECDAGKKQADQKLAEEMKKLWDEKDDENEKDEKVKKANRAKRDKDYLALATKREDLRKNWLYGVNAKLGIQWRLCSNRELQGSYEIRKKVEAMEAFLGDKNPNKPVDAALLRAAGKMDNANADMLKKAYELCSKYRTAQEKIKEMTDLFKRSKSTVELWEKGLKIETKGGDVEVSLPDLQLLDNEELFSLLLQMVENIVSLDIQSVSKTSLSTAFGQFFDLCPHLKRLKRLKITTSWGNAIDPMSFFNIQNLIGSCKIQLPTKSNEGMFLSAIAVIPGLEELELASTSKNSGPLKLDNSEEGIQYWIAAIERCKTVKLPYFLNITSLLDRIRRLKDINRRERHFELRVSEKNPLDCTLAGGLFEELLCLIVAGEGKVSVGFSGPFNNSESKKFSISKALCRFGVENLREELFTPSTKKKIKDPKTNEEHDEITEGVDEKWLAFLKEEEKFSNGERGDVRIYKLNTLTYNEVSNNLEDWLRVFGIPTKEFAEEVMKLYTETNSKAVAVHALVENALTEPKTKQQAEEHSKELEAAKEEAKKKAEYKKTHADYNDFQMLLDGFPVYICGLGVFEEKPTKGLARLTCFGDYMAFFFAAFLSHLDEDSKSYYFFDTKVSMGKRPIGVAFPGFGDGEAFPAHRKSGKLNDLEQADILQLAIQYSKEFAGKKSLGAYSEVAELVSLQKEYDKITLDFGGKVSPGQVLSDIFGISCERFPKFVQTYARLKGLQYNATLYHKKTRVDGSQTDSRLFDICKCLIQAKVYADEVQRWDARIAEEQKTLKSLLGKKKPKPEEKEKKVFIENVELPIFKERREEYCMKLKEEINTLSESKKYLAGFVELIRSIKRTKTPSSVVRVHEDGSLDNVTVSDPAFNTPDAFAGKTTNMTSPNPNPNPNPNPKNAGNGNAPAVSSLLKAVLDPKLKKSKGIPGTIKRDNSMFAVGAWVRGGRKVKYMDHRYGSGCSLSETLGKNKVVVPPAWCCPMLQYTGFVDPITKEKTLRMLNKGETPNLDIVQKLVEDGKMKLKQDIDKNGKPIPGSYYVQFSVIEEN